MRRMKSSPIFLLISFRLSEITPFVASCAGIGVVSSIVEERRSSYRPVLGMLAMVGVRFVVGLPLRFVLEHG